MAAVLVTASTGDATWRNVIMAAFHLVVPATVGLKAGLPIAIKTRAVPTHLPKVLAAQTSGILLDTFDSIPLYTEKMVAGDADKIKCEYPDGTWVDVACVQEVPE